MSGHGREDAFDELVQSREAGEPKAGPHFFATNFDPLSPPAFGVSMSVRARSKFLLGLIVGAKGGQVLVLCPPGRALLAAQPCPRDLRNGMGQGGGASGAAFDISSRDSQHVAEGLEHLR